MFISEHYAKKQWTTHERQSAQARAFTESEEYILPARFDDTEIPGLQSTVLYVPLSEITPLKFADMIVQKVEARTAQRRPTQIVPARPVSENEKQSGSAVTALVSDPFTVQPPQSSLALFKDYLAEERFRIRLNDHVVEETEALFIATHADKFPLATPFSNEEAINRVQRYEVLVEPLAKRLFLGCRWGAAIHELLWVEVLTRIGNPLSLVGAGSYMEIWANLRFYPTLLLLYSAGISCVLYERYENLAAVTTKPLILNEMTGTSKPVGLQLYPTYVIDSEIAEALSGKQRLYTPVSDYLESMLWNTFMHEIRWRPRFDAAFMRFEYLLALIHADLNTTSSWVPVGNFVWKQRRNPENSIYIKMDEEINNLGESMPLLQAGLFNGSVERLKEVKKAVDEHVAKVRGHLHIF